MMLSLVASESLAGMRVHGHLIVKELLKLGGHIGHLL
jgi:hypothetical protein